MYRALRLAERAGIDATPAPVHSRVLFTPFYKARECLAIIKMWIQETAGWKARIDIPLRRTRWVLYPRSFEVSGCPGTGLRTVAAIPAGRGSAACLATRRRGGKSPPDSGPSFLNPGRGFFFLWNFTSYFQESIIEIGRSMDSEKSYIDNSNRIFYHVIALSFSNHLWRGSRSWKSGHHEWSVRSNESESHGSAPQRSSCFPPRWPTQPSNREKRRRTQRLPPRPKSRRPRWKRNRRWRKSPRHPMKNWLTKFITTTKSPCPRNRFGKTTTSP